MPILFGPFRQIYLRVKNWYDHLPKEASYRDDINKKTELALALARGLDCSFSIYMLVASIYTWVKLIQLTNTNAAGQEVDQAQANAVDTAVITSVFIAGGIANYLAKKFNKQEWLMAFVQIATYLPLQYGLFSSAVTDEVANSEKTMSGGEAISLQVLSVIFTCVTSAQNNVTETYIQTKLRAKNLPELPAWFLARVLEGLQLSGLALNMIYTVYGYDQAEMLTDLLYPETSQMGKIDWSLLAVPAIARIIVSVITRVWRNKHGASQIQAEPEAQPVASRAMSGYKSIWDQFNNDPKGFSMVNRCLAGPVSFYTLVSFLESNNPFLNIVISPCMVLAAAGGRLRFAREAGYVERIENPATVSNNKYLAHRLQPREMNEVDEAQQPLLAPVASSLHFSNSQATE